jgi:hypothetical protein
MDLLAWRRKKLEYEDRERADRSNRVTVGDATPWHAGVNEQVLRDLLDRVSTLEAKAAPSLSSVKGSSAESNKGTK